MREQIIAELEGQSDGVRKAKKIEGATALRPLRPLSIVPQSFLRFPAQSGREDKPGNLAWQVNSSGFLVESCARLCKTQEHFNPNIGQGGITDWQPKGQLLLPAMRFQETF